MTVQIDIPDEVAARLATAAEERGVPVEEYIRGLLQDVVTAKPVGTGRMTIEEFHAFLEEFRKGAENIPSLPDEAFTRESFYEGR